MKRSGTPGSRPAGPWPPGAGTGPPRQRPAGPAQGGRRPGPAPGPGRPGPPGRLAGHPILEAQRPRKPSIGTPPGNCRRRPGPAGDLGPAAPGRRAEGGPDAEVQWLRACGPWSGAPSGAGPGPCPGGSRAHPVPGRGTISGPPAVAGRGPGQAAPRVIPPRPGPVAPAHNPRFSAAGARRPGWPRSPRRPPGARWRARRRRAEPQHRVHPHQQVPVDAQQARAGEGGLHLGQGLPLGAQPAAGVGPDHLVLHLEIGGLVQVHQDHPLPGLDRVAQGPGAGARAAREPGPAGPRCASGPAPAGRR